MGFVCKNHVVFCIVMSDELPAVTVDLKGDVLADVLQKFVSVNSLLVQCQLPFPEAGQLQNIVHHFLQAVVFVFDDIHIGLARVGVGVDAFIAQCFASE